MVSKHSYHEHYESMTQTVVNKYDILYKNKIQQS